MSKKNPYFVVKVEDGKLVKESPACTSNKAIIQWCKDNDYSLHALGNETALTNGNKYGCYQLTQSYIDNWVAPTEEPSKNGPPTLHHDRCKLIQEGETISVWEWRTKSWDTVKLTGPAWIDLNILCVDFIYLSNGNTHSANWVEVDGGLGYFESADI